MQDGCRALPRIRIPARTLGYPATPVTERWVRSRHVYTRVHVSDALRAAWRGTLYDVALRAPRA